MTFASRVRIAVLGLGLGLATTGTAAVVGYVSARAQPVLTDAPPGIGLAPVAPIHIDDPLANPQATIDDLAAAKRHGWPALVLGSLIAVALGLRTAGKRWPDVDWLSWLNTGKRAFWIAGVIAVGSAALDVIALGGAPFAAGWAGFAALLALINAKGD